MWYLVLMYFMLCKCDMMFIGVDLSGKFCKDCVLSILFGWWMWFMVFFNSFCELESECRIILVSLV